MADELRGQMKWRSVTEPPEKNCYVLLACLHHKTIPTVLYGFCKISPDGAARFSEQIYHGQGLSITHWMPLPKHPLDKEAGSDDRPLSLLSDNG